MSGERHLDRATDGSVLEWVEHPLSGTMTELGLAELAREPRVRAFDDEVRALGLSISLEADGVHWSWAGWQDVSLRFLRAGRSTSAADERWPRRPDEIHATLTWPRFADAGADAVEITPARPRTMGMTHAVAVPLGVPTDRVRFSSSRAGVVEVAFARDARARLDASTLVALRLAADNNTFVAAGRVICAASGGAIDIGPGFQGVVVLLATPSGGVPMFVDARQVWNGDCRKRPTVDEWERLRAALRLPSESRRWPVRSASALAALCEAASRHLPLDEAWRAVNDTPTSLSRWLVARAIGERSPWVASEWEPHATSTFAATFETRYPGLLPLMGRVRSAAQKTWVFENRSNAAVADAVSRAPAASPAGLDIAVRLQLWHTRLTAAAAHVRADSALHRQVASLLRQIAAAPETLRAPDAADMQRVLDGVAAEQRDAASPDAVLRRLDAEAPATVELFDCWTAARAARGAWRRDAFTVLRYCATGRWAPPDREPLTSDLAGLVQAVDDITRTAIVDGGGADGDRLLAAAASVRTRRDAESDATTRALVIDVVSTRVAGYERGWAALWATLDAAIAPAAAYPQLAAFFGLDAEWAVRRPCERHAAAHLFVQTVRQLEEFAVRFLAAYPDPVLASPQRLRPLLGLGEPDLVHAARAQTLGLFDRLAGKDGLQPPAPLTDRPAAPTAAACGEWWRSLCRCERDLRWLTWLAGDLDAVAAWVRSAMQRGAPHVIPVPPEHGGRFVDLAGACRAWREST